MAEAHEGSLGAGAADPARVTPTPDQPNVVTIPKVGETVLLRGRVISVMPGDHHTTVLIRGRFRDACVDVLPEQLINVPKHGEASDA